MTLPAGEAILKVVSIRNPNQEELDRLLMPIKPPEIEEEEWGARMRYVFRWLVNRRRYDRCQYSIMTPGAGSTALR